MLSVVDDVAEVADPVAQYDGAGLVCELLVDLYVSVPVDEVVDVRVVLYVVFCE